MRKIHTLILLIFVTMNICMSFFSQLRHRPAFLHFAKPSRAMRKATKAAERASLMKNNVNNSTRLKRNINISPDVINEMSLEDQIAVFRKTNNVKKLLFAVEQQSKNYQLTLNQTIIALKALGKMGKDDKISVILDNWLDMNRKPSTFEDFNSTALMIRFFAMRKDIPCIEKLTNHLSFVIPSDPSRTITLPITSVNRDVLKRLLGDLCFTYINVGDAVKATHCLKLMKQYEMDLNIVIARKILKEFVVQSTTEHIRRCLRLLIHVTEGLDDMEAVHIVNNAFIRSIEFMKGAVSLATLPPEACAEVCFIGRSNVGKSSLINTICNRKNVAYVSKKPGKTAEFNYYNATGVIGPKNDMHQFYLVDLPGVGYALKSRQLRENWTNLLRDFVQYRSTLRVIFHLVDSRHGLLDTDEECLSLLENLPANVQYVVVLTKVDKQRGAEKRLDVNEAIVDKIYHEIGLRTTRIVPILFTSSLNKLGVASLWSTLLDGIHRIIPKDSVNNAVDTNKNE